MNFLQPYLCYFICALIMCIVYCGLEKSSGSLGMTAKSVMCIWCILSTVIAVALYGLQSVAESGIPPSPQTTGITFGASIITLCVSSSCVYCAQ